MIDDMGDPRARGAQTALYEALVADGQFVPRWLYYPLWPNGGFVWRNGLIVALDGSRHTTQGRTDALWGDVDTVDKALAVLRSLGLLGAA